MRKRVRDKEKKKKIKDIDQVRKYTRMRRISNEIFLET